MKYGESVTIFKLCIIAGLILSVMCTSAYGIAPSSTSGVANQLDKKVRAIFNEKSPLANYDSADKAGEKLYHLNYESGFKVTLSVSDKSISIVEYQHGAAAKKVADLKSEQSCKEENHRTHTSAEVDLFLRKSNEIEFTWVVASFKILKDGYLIEYKRGELRWIFQLDWDLKIRRRQSNSSTVKVNEKQVESSTRQMILDFLYQNSGLRVYKNVQVERVERIGVKTYKIVLIIATRTRKVRYEAIVSEGPKSFLLQDAQFNIDFTAAYREEASYDKELIQMADSLVKDNVKGSILQGFTLFKVQSDEPLYRFSYKKGQTIILVEFIFDTVTRRVKVTRSQSVKTQPAAPTVQNTGELTESKKTEIFSFVTQHFGQFLPKGAVLETINRVGQRKYIIIIRFVIRQRQLKYQITLSQNQNGKYTIDDGEMLNNFNPSYQESTDFESLRDIDIIVKQSLSEKLPSGAKLVKVQRDDPFYKFFYTFGLYSFQVNFSFDFLIRKIVVSNFKSEKAPQVIVKEPVIPVKEPKEPREPVKPVVPKDDELTEVRKNEIFASVGQRFIQLPQGAQVESINQIGQRKYIIIYRITLGRRQLKYQVIVTQNRNDQYQIEDGQFNIDFTPVYQESTDFQSVKDIDTLVRKVVPEKIPSGFTLTKIQRDDPFFRFFYTLGGSSYQVEFTYDPFTRKVSLVSLKVEKASETVVIVKEPVVPVKEPVVVPKTDEFTDDKKNEIFAFVRQTFGTFPRGAQLESVSRIGQRKYILVFKITLGKRQLKYQVVVSQGQNNQYQIEDAQFNVDFSPILQEFTDIESVKDIDVVVRQSLPEKIPSGFTLTRVQRDDPFFRFFYTLGGSSYQIDFTYDLFTRKVFLVNVRVEKVQEPVVTVVKETVNSVTKPVVPAKQPVAVPKTDEFTEEKKNEIFAFVGQTFGTFPQGAQLESVSRIGQRKYVLIFKITFGRRQLKYQVVVSQGQNNQYQIEDAQFNVDFTPVFQDFTDFESVRDIDVVVRQSLPEKIPSGFTLTRVQRDDPFFRFFYTLGGSSYQIDFTYDPFARRVFLVNVRVEKVQEPVVTVVKETVNSVTKPTIIVQEHVKQTKPSVSTTTAATTTTISAQPSQNELDFVTYNLVKYSDAEISSIYNTIQKQFRDFDFKSSRTLRVQKIAYGFRLIIAFGQELYEAVLKFDSLNGQYRILRWRRVTQKESESNVSFYDFATISLDKDLESILLKTFPRQKLGHIKRIIEAKSKITSDGLYYEISLETDSDNQYLVSIYYKPEDSFTEILSYEQTNSKYYLSRQELNSLGEEIKSVEPSNADLQRVFEFIDGKFSTFSSASVLYIYRIQVSRLGVVVYRIGLRTSSGFYFEIAAAVSSSDVFLIKYSKIFDGYSASTAEGADTKSVIEFYRREAQKLNLSGSEVNGILFREIPSIGRFYRLVFVRPYRYSIIIFVSSQGTFRINGVEPIPSYYQFLINGNFRSFGQLRSLLNKFKPIKLEPTVQQKPITIIYDYDASQDMNCLRYNQQGCIRCSYRFYLNKGRCVPVPDECKEYNKETGECLTCYTGYSMQNGVCGAMNQLCQAADSYGRCVQCYKGYNLIDGLCYRIQSQSSSNLKRQSMDQLCEEERNGQCIRCTPGTYYSQKQRKCAIKDPFAQEFDEVNEVVIRCARGCALAPAGNCVRVK